MSTKGKVQDMLDLLRKDGWIQIKANAGDHRQFLHPVKSGKVTVRGKPGLDVDVKLWNHMLRQAGLGKWEG